MRAASISAGLPLVGTRSWQLDDRLHYTANRAAKVWIITDYSKKESAAMVSRNDCSTIARVVEIGGTLGVVWIVVGVEELCKNCLLGYTELQYSILIEYKTIGKFYSKIVFYVAPM